jgi:hypothetical protein
MKAEDSQLYSLFQHIFEYSNGKLKNHRMLFNELYPTKPQRHAPAIIILKTYNLNCFFTWNLNRELAKKLPENNCKVFFRFINLLARNKFKHLLDNEKNKLAYLGRQ